LVPVALVLGVVRGRAQPGRAHHQEPGEVAEQQRLGRADGGLAGGGLEVGGQLVEGGGDLAGQWSSFQGQ
jgi:hypothetical protein